MLSGCVGARFAKDGEVGTDPELSLEIDPAGEPGIVNADGLGVDRSWSAMRLRFAGLASGCRGVDVDGVADASETSDIADAIDCDLDLWNFSSEKASLPMSLNGDSDRDSASAIFVSDDQVKVVLLATFEGNLR